MAWVKFEETGKSFAPKASLNSRGYLSFNDGARLRWKLNEYGYAALHYDPDCQKVGIEFGNDPEASGALKLRKRPTGITIGAKAFLDFFNITIQKTTSYQVEQVGAANFVAIDLNKGTERKSGTKEEEDDDGSDLA